MRTNSIDSEVSDYQCYF